jgi:PhzF family phenazine biosynthesis protein
MAPSTLSFVTLDVFTTTRYTGNPLAIVNVPASLSTLSQSQKQRIAREFNLSETVFLHEQTDSDSASSSVRMDIFTAHAEVPFAGHPTVGTANYLLRILDLQNDSNPALNQVKALQAKAGRFGITLDQAVNGTRIAVPHDVHIHADHPFADRPFFDRYQYPVVSIVKGMTFVLAQLPDLEVLARQTKNLLGPENTYTSQDALDQGWRTGIVATYVSPSMDSSSPSSSSSSSSLPDVLTIVP